mmetsp:Transcript_26064/g.43037  ORF Transcript_26064/g.43037 Transcript_26064/m.43037 type:complete len:304 (+) Transcript_26064:55-966(+)
MPLLVSAPKTVVHTTDVKIDEFFGGASCNPCNGDISFAYVVAQPDFAEEWQTPAFDEYTIVIKGEVNIEHSHGSPVKVCAGQAVFMPKGERVRWVIGSSGAEYVPVCLPAFSPANCFREEEGIARPDHDAHTAIYHLVQVPLWEECKVNGKTYYPPTYQQDGFTHATADPSKLLGVANHFYKPVRADWKCLKMTRSSLAAAGITLKFEDPSPVGAIPALTPSLSGGLRFPHIFGGIPTNGVVIDERVVYRGPGGEYVGIEGLCGMSKGEVEQLWREYSIKRAALLAAGAATVLAVGLWLTRRL